MQARLVKPRVQSVLQYRSQVLHWAVLDGFVHEDVFPGGLHGDEVPSAYLLQLPLRSMSDICTQSPTCESS